MAHTIEILELKANNPDNNWVIINLKSGIVVSEGKTPIEATQNAPKDDDCVLSYVTNDAQSYIL